VPDLPDPTQHCFALLDDASARADQPASRLYTDCVRELYCADPGQLDAFEQELTRALAAEHLHALLLADYEWGMALQGIDARAKPGPQPAALRVLLFRRLQKLTPGQTQDWLEQAASAAPSPDAGMFGWRSHISQHQFEDGVNTIRAAIKRGETYQVNYTFPLSSQAYGSPIALYRQLRQRQPAPYGALIHRPPRPGQEHDGQAEWILSLSPELFLRSDGTHLVAQPMKGTAAANADDGANLQASAWLRNDPKNRAENLMIVDLLRNDLGRIAVTGSVKVDALFDVHQHGSVLQMTSRIQARLRPHTRLQDILRAGFPCGSITGAPKHRTMQLIDRLESERRGLYTGAIGWLDAPAPDSPGAQAGAAPFCLSVPIRTLQLQPRLADGLYPARLAVGAGIVWDSKPEEEWRECQTKAGFATGNPVGLALFETLRAELPGAIAHLELHLQRLERSAAALGFPFDPALARQTLLETAQKLGPGLYRLRLALESDGALGVTHGAITDLPDVPKAHDMPLTLVAAHGHAHHAIPPALRRHKTTLRAALDAELALAAERGAFDALLFNEQDLLTEGTRSNVFVQCDGQWLTPPVNDGLLPGVMRGLILADPRWQAREASISRAQLHQAEAIMVCNALRGVRFARLLN